MHRCTYSIAEAALISPRLSRILKFSPKLRVVTDLSWCGSYAARRSGASSADYIIDSSLTPELIFVPSATRISSRYVQRASKTLRWI